MKVVLVKKVRAIGAILIFAGTVASGVVPPPPNETNWLSHPAVVEIRGLVERIDEQERRGILASARCREKEWGGMLIIWRDNRGKAVKYVRDGCGEDSCWKYTHYYDGCTRLRFVLVVIRAVNRSQIEYRHYFDVAGTRIWSKLKLLSGAGYPVGPDEFNAGLAAFDPEAEFSRYCSQR